MLSSDSRLKPDAGRSFPTLSVVIATAFREAELVNSLGSLASQTRVPDEVIVVDGAPAPGVEALVRSQGEALGLSVQYLRAHPPSAAVQRNVGIDRARGDVILFLDDDAYPDVDCLNKMMMILERSPTVGGVGVLIRNQLCHPPSSRAKRWFDFLSGERRESYSGSVIGPAINIGPYPTQDGRVIEVEWLNSGCTAYRREALAAERFCPTFYGYSFMEDVDLSVRVAMKWRLVVHTGAMMYHDSKPSCFKAPFTRSRMSVCNRYHVMVNTLGRRSWSMHFKFVVYHAVTWASALVRCGSATDIYTRVIEGAGLLSGLMTILPTALGVLVRGRGTPMEAADSKRIGNGPKRT